MDSKDNFGVKALPNKAYCPTRLGKERSVAQQGQVMRLWEHVPTRPGEKDVETLPNRAW